MKKFKIRYIKDNNYYIDYIEAYSIRDALYTFYMTVPISDVITIVEVREEVLSET